MALQLLVQSLPLGEGFHKEGILPSLQFAHNDVILVEVTAFVISVKIRYLDE